MIIVITTLLLLLLIFWNVAERNDWYSEPMYGEDPPGGIGYKEHLKRNNLQDILPLYLMILTALILRTAMLYYSDLFFVGDAKAYYEISQSLEVPGYIKLKYGITNWFEWSPIHVLYLYVIDQNLQLQILVSIITLITLYKVNTKLAWFWCLYPVAIAYSVSYNKENLLFLFIAIVLYLQTKKKWYLLLIFPVMLLFSGAYQYNFSLNRGYMWNFWEIWKPDFNILCNFGQWVNYVLFIPYAAVIIYYFRTTRLNLTLIVIVCYTAVFTVIHGNSRFREPILILLVYEVIKKPD